ncbi:MAG: hypothetical protein LBO03_07960 [Acidaminococcales bacterium]|nr:hypothetical protein [Acidaminococcales bacterium]
MSSRKFLSAICLLLALALAPPPAGAEEFFVDGYVCAADVSETGDHDRKSVAGYDNAYDLFTDHANGYRLLIPKGSFVDISATSLRNVFETPSLAVEIYHDNFSGKAAGFHELVNYSNKFLRRGIAHRVTAEYPATVGGCPAVTSKWSRGKLSRVENDKNYYTATSVRRSRDETYTIMVKSALPGDDRAERITESFSFIERQGTPRDGRQPYAGTSPMNPATRAVYEEIFSSGSGLTWGIFENSAPQTFRQLAEKERALGHRFKILLRYQSVDEPLPLAQLERAWQRGRLVELTLATIHDAGADALKTEGATANALVSYEILNGHYDEYFAAYARDLKKFGKPVLFRLNNEMNGDWCWYSAFYTARDPRIYVELWRYIRKLFDEAGVDNLIWIWNPHDASLPDFAWNSFAAYYPGDEYVDVVGLTGYNAGTYFPGEKWRAFDEIYRPLYEKYLSFFAKPFMITEFSSNSVGGDKAAWIRDMFAKIAKYPNIKAAVWWNGVDYDRSGHPGRVYLVDDSPEVAAALSEGLRAYPSSALAATDE